MARIGSGLRAALVLGGLMLPGVALAQTRPPPASGPGQPTLQTEPGDFWSDVKAWNEQARRRTARGGRPEATAPAELAPNPPPNTPRRPPPRRPRPDPG